MGPEISTRAKEDLQAGGGMPEPHAHRELNAEYQRHYGLDWVLIGDQGLRAGCSLVIFITLFRLFTLILSVIAVGLYPRLANSGFSPGQAFFGELVLFLALFGASAIVAFFERRHLSDFYLTGPRLGTNFISGLSAGFLALSTLIAALAIGGWVHFGPVALSGISVAKYALIWGCTFVLVACFEEGMFRCYLQYTLARSINFWWALAIVSTVCVDLVLRSRGQVGTIAFFWMQSLGAIKGNGMWGVFVVALLGLGPCLRLQMIGAKESGFWQAAWVTSTLFGYLHVGNNGENWIGIFAAAAIGFVFCVSIWLTGSALWAIGCHAGWDWGETYFYGTADSGMVAQGHYLSTSPFGKAFWSGGTAGPEGSFLVLGAILLLLMALFVVHRPRKSAQTQQGG
jgi:membrane protease YdiL (CAAX protease family)